MNEWMNEWSVLLSLAWILIFALFREFVCVWLSTECPYNTAKAYI